MELKLVIVSGLSGSGKTHALKCFEDMGFFCVDNLPPALLPVFADLCLQSTTEIKKVAVGIDIREGDFLRDFMAVSDEIKRRGIQYELVFFEAREEILIRRFSETRRPHPLARNRPVHDGIELEKEQLAELRKKSNRIIDTSEYTIHQLKRVLHEYYFGGREGSKPVITLISFGYKYGIPYETDLLFDVRFLQNPYFIPELNPLSGQDEAVVNYIFKRAEAGEFIGQVKSFISFLVPYYEKDGRSNMTVAIGCTGGRHRSVAIADALISDLNGLGYESVISHRDINRDR